MTSLAQLWQKRFAQFAKELGKYGRLIFNDHFSIILFVILGFGAFFYREQLVRLQAMDTGSIRLPIIVIAVIILAVCFQLGKPMWLTKDSDKSYLFARGKEWHAYWLKGTLLAVILPVIILLAAVVLLSPFISLVTSWSSEQLLLLCVYLALAKVLSFVLIYLNIFTLGLGKIQQPLNQWHHTLAFVLVLTSSFLLPSRPWHILMFGIVLIGLSAYVLWALTQREQRLIQFEYVIEQETARESTFYKWIAIFADVPHLVPSVKRRAFLDGLLENLSKRLANRGSYMYLRMLFRNNAYSGVWLRVMLFIAVMLLLVDQLYMAMILGAIGHLLTVVQLVPLIHYYDAHPFQQLYPVQIAKQYQAFQPTMMIIFIIQTAFYALVWSFIQGFNFTWLLVAGTWLATAALLSYFYIPLWDRKQNNTH
ncbi:ABC transporter permease [Fundicoccus sp. Sow4_F4]|uniref:ABC transporter permease n=1 Tax=Fundicoccus sp. Sow4_F4 TaxID=3438783 RepID=UPI003F8F70F7